MALWLIICSANAGGVRAEACLGCEACLQSKDDNVKVLLVLKADSFFGR